MSHSRQGYNAKARQSSTISRKDKKIDLVAQAAQMIDPNISIIIPKSKDEKEKERKERLKQEFVAASESKWNSKKKKRLDKYIDKKLKKEERTLLYQKLAHTQASLSSYLLQSSSTLGTGNTSTHKERLEKEESKEVKLAFLGRSGKRKRHADVCLVTDQDSDSDVGTLLRTQDETEPISQIESTAQKQEVKVVDAPMPGQPSGVKPIEVGNALKKSDGSFSASASHLASITQGWGCKRRKQTPSANEETDTSFDSSDSEYGLSKSDNSESNSVQIDESGDEHLKQVTSSDIEPKRRSLGFKEWALKQLSVAKGYDDCSPLEEPLLYSQTSSPPPLKKKRKIDIKVNYQDIRGPLGTDLKLPATSFAKQVLNLKVKKLDQPHNKIVDVKRPLDVEETRLMLPIVAEEQLIMESVLLNPVVIICGETGSGKTTQVPQFLYEAGFGTSGSENPGMIGITQPRRVAAVSMASRVAHELSLTSSKVSYQIRYDATVSSSTAIKFMTDGVLLRELATDFLLTKYSAIIIDEAHERNMNTDVLIGVLSRVIRLRENLWTEGKEGARPLRLIIMSATLRISDFAENKSLFQSSPPVINIAARQHPVTVHFSRRTSSDYVTEAIRKTTKIHNRLPPGGILVFLTGQNEITGVCRKLESLFSKEALEKKAGKRNVLQNRVTTKSIVEGQVPFQVDVEPEDIDLGDNPEGLAFDLDEDPEDEDLNALDSDEPMLDETFSSKYEKQLTPMHIIPLYSMLPNEKQMRVFQPPPPDSRLVVISTNVAETSLTIPGIRYVVDCGRAKERRYDIANGIQAFQVSWISKASAAQRAGRAGRTGPGHCYRLYSSALYEHHFDQFSKPEILRMPVDGVVLQMKSMHIDAIVNFPFPTPPNKSMLQKAEKTLVHLGALTATSLRNNGGFTDGQITDLGRSMALFPLSPRFARMLVGSQQNGCLPYVIAVVSAMSVGDPFLYEEVLDVDRYFSSENDETDVSAKDDRSNRRRAFFQSQQMHSSLGGYTSDMFKVLSVVGAYECSGEGQKFCSDHFVRPKAMQEIHKLRGQISNIVQANFSGIDANVSLQIPPPSEIQLQVLRQLLTAAFIDQVAIRKDLVDRSESDGVQYARSKGVPYRALGIMEDVFIHPTSVLTNTMPPNYVIFQEIVKTSRVYMKGLTIVNSAWLSSLGSKSLCTFSKPVKNTKGVLMVIPRFGPEGWELPAVTANTIK